MHISRHPINEQAMTNSCDAYRSLKDSALTRFDGDKRLLSNLSEYFVNLFYYSTLLEKTPEKPLNWLNQYIEASVAKYRIADSNGEEIGFEFMQKEYKVSRLELDWVTVPDWTRAYMAAVTLQNEKAVRKLAVIDLEKINQKKETKGFEYTVLFSEFLQHLYEKGYEHGKNLLKVSKASMEVPKTSLLYDYMLDIAGPQIDLLTCVLFKEEDKFNDMLKKSLLSFKQYYVRQGSKGKTNPEGLVSIPLCAIVRLAKDVGLPIHHTSDYLPAYLID